MAVISRSSLVRALLVTGLLGLLPLRPECQERGPTAPSGVDFLQPAYELSLFQARASELLTGKDTRAEVNDFAAQMLEFRTSQLASLRELAVRQGVVLRDELKIELRSIIDNMKPLESLELSRRYIEVAVQALDIELAGYRRAVIDAQPDIKAYASSTTPRLEQLAGAARKASGEVRP